MSPVKSDRPPPRRGLSATGHDSGRKSAETKTNAQRRKDATCAAPTPPSVYTPPPSEKENVKPATLAQRLRKRAKEPACLKAWRERMASQAGQAVYALRKRIERINADRKNHGFGFLPVRGLIKARAHALWHALANNLMAAHRLRIETP